MSGSGIVGTGLLFTSWGEVAFAALMLLPLLFCVACVLYLLRLTLNAAAERGRVVVLPRPEIVAAPANPETAKPAERGQNAFSPLTAFSATSFRNSLASDDSASRNGLTETSLAEGHSGHRARFTLLIPAHNEEMLLGAALSALQQLQYPRGLYEIVVIADNCSDYTASIARQSGALALERFDTERIGKGYALEDTLAWLLSENQNETARAKAEVDSADPDSIQPSIHQSIHPGTKLLAGQTDVNVSAAWSRARCFDAVVILDADTFVSSNLLAVFADALQNGQTVVQARYDVLNTDDSWRTRLMSCALALAHVVKPLGRERLRLSDGLKGNGMCFARQVVLNVPWSGESITEDIEYTLRVCTAGYRVAFVSEACVWAQMPTTGAQAASQRQRWEGGRYRLLFQVAPRLLAESLRTHNRLLRDRAIELIVPPFAEMFALPALCGGLCALLAWLCGWHLAGLLAGTWAMVLLLQAVYLFGGMWVARMPANVVFSLLAAPLYIIWKLGLYVVMAAGRSTGGWKRTERHELSSK